MSKTTAGQSKNWSRIEIITGTVIGYAVAVFTQIMIFPFFNISISVSENFVMAAVFTVISLVRGYYVRRFFNWVHINIIKDRDDVKELPTIVMYGDRPATESEMMEFPPHARSPLHDLPMKPTKQPTYTYDSKEPLPDMNWKDNGQ